MSKLIKNIIISKYTAFVGESIKVTVDTNDNDTEVTVNGIYGSQQFLQFKSSGTYTVVILATLGKEIEEAGYPITIADEEKNKAPFPIINATLDPYQSRRIIFTVNNSNNELKNFIGYTWNFGDGTVGESNSGVISHDYSTSMNKDKLVTSFDVTLQAKVNKDEIVNTTRTIGIFNLYSYNKIRKGILTPRVDVIAATTIDLISQVVCSFTITNFEDEELSLSGERHEWLSTTVDEPASNEMAGFTAIKSIKVMDVAFKGIISKDNLSKQLAASKKSLEIRIPPLSTVSLIRSFPQSDFSIEKFGVVIHFKGSSICAKQLVIASAYIEVNLPMKWSTPVQLFSLTNGLSVISKLKSDDKSRVTHKDILSFVQGKNLPQRPLQNNASIVTMKEAFRNTEATTSIKAKEISSPGTLANIETKVSLSSIEDNVLPYVFNLLSPDTTSFDISPGVVYGNPCDPDNPPDYLPEGAVCQLTGEYEWRYVPGRILNAKKGDVLLEPGGGGLIGQLLRQVAPAQFYAHCGIMTKNHIEIRHSTASEEWILDNKAGEMLGKRGVDGFDPAALKFPWPGTVTQSIDQATNGQYLPSPPSILYPTGNQYKIGPFSLGSNGTLPFVNLPLVIKPSPFEETAQVRDKLHAIANEAAAINGHYRFYCYTKPEICLTSEGMSDSGWSKGTVATCCSSFIWLAAQKAGIRLEGPSANTNVVDLEPRDIAGGAAVNSDTLDGLYYYTADERLAAAKWLYQSVYDKTHDEAGCCGTLFSDAPDNVANQICNIFASDWADSGSKDSDAWKSVGAANAVSPDNIMFWDGPGSENQNNFSSVYGYTEELFYRPGTYAKVPIYRWNHVETKGNLTGTVIADSNVSGAVVSLLGSGESDVVVGDDGHFVFDEIPEGDYTITAGLNIKGYWYSTEATVHINAGVTNNISITLQPPAEIYRTITISVNMESDYKSVWAHGSPSSTFSQAQFIKVHPFKSHAHLDFEGAGYAHGRISFDIDLNPDLSVTVAWDAKEMQDEGEGGVSGGYTIARDSSLSWKGMKVTNDDPIDSDWTYINFEIYNDLSS